MTFPTPRTPIASSAVATTTARVVDLPAGIQAGDLLVVVALAFSTAGDITPPAGWALMPGDWGDGISGGSSAAGIYWKIAVGGETSATWVAQNTSGSMYYAAMAFRDASSFEYTFSSRDGLTTMDSPSITPSWGLADNLFCAVHLWSSVGDAPSGYPSGYSLMQAYSGSGTTGVRASGRQSAAATEDPPSVSSTSGAFSLGRAATLAIRPLIAAQAVARGGYMMG